MERRKFFRLLAGLPLLPAAFAVVESVKTVCLKPRSLGYTKLDVSAASVSGYCSPGLLDSSKGVLLAETSFMLNGEVVHKTYNKMTDDGIDFTYTIQGE